MFLWGGELVWIPIRKSGAIEMASCDAFLEGGKCWVSPLPHGGTQMVSAAPEPRSALSSGFPVSQ